MNYIYFYLLLCLFACLLAWLLPSLPLLTYLLLVYLPPFPPPLFLPSFRLPPNSSFTSTHSILLVIKLVGWMDVYGLFIISFRYCWVWVYI